MIFLFCNKLDYTRVYFRRVVKKFIPNHHCLFFVRHKQFYTYKRTVIIKRGAGYVGFAVLMRNFKIGILGVLKARQHLKGGGISPVFNRKGERGFKRFGYISSAFGYYVGILLNIYGLKLTAFAKRGNAVVNLKAVGNTFVMQGVGKRVAGNRLVYRG